MKLLLLIALSLPLPAQQHLRPLATHGPGTFARAFALQRGEGVVRPLPLMRAEDSELPGISDNLLPFPGCRENLRLSFLGSGVKRVTRITFSFSLPGQFTRLFWKPR